MHAPPPWPRAVEQVLFKCEAESSGSPWRQAFVPRLELGHPCLGPLFCRVSEEMGTPESRC